MSEISKAVGQWMLENIGWTAIIILFLLSCFFKVVKKEIDPLGWVVGLLGKSLTKDVRKDVADLKANTEAKIEDLKQDYNDKIQSLRSDIDAFEDLTNRNVDGISASVNSMTAVASQNYKLLKARMDKMEKSNDMQTIRQIKVHVLDFANSCMNHHRHTKQDFESIIKENEEYEKLVKKYKLRNDVYREDFEFIMKVFHRCQEEGSFLTGSEAET